MDNLGREAVAAIAELGHHRWLQLNVTDGKPNDDVTRPIRIVLDGLRGEHSIAELCRREGIRSIAC